MNFERENGRNWTGEAPLFRRESPTTLIGGGVVNKGDLALALKWAPPLVAADGGAERALAAGHMPDAVYGDMDSLDAQSLGRIPADRLHRIAEQDSTDFDKALRHIQAPLVLAVGVTGARVDHELAAYHSLLCQSHVPVIILGAADIVLHVDRPLSLDLPEGTRVSLFPMQTVSGRSTGLRWPIDGLEFHPATRIGTSNAAIGGPVHLSFDGAGMLLILPRDCLPVAVSALQGTAA